MKKLITEKKAALLLVLALITCITYGNFIWANETGGQYINQEYNLLKMMDLNGNEHSFKDSSGQNSTVNERTGIGIEYTGTMKKLITGNRLAVMELGSMGYSFMYLPENTKKSQEGIVNISEDNTFFYMAVYRVPETRDEETEMYLDLIKKSFSKTEKLAGLKGSAYYLAYNRDHSSLKLSDSDRQKITWLTDDIDKLKDYICIFSVDDSSFSQVGKFNAPSVNGISVNQDIFKKYDLTMMNIWSTDCKPCKEEMPGLQKLYEQLPDNINFISLCIDGGFDITLTKNIIEKYKCKFTVIYPDANLSRSILRQYTFVPVTIFIDKNGNIIGGPMGGAPSDKVPETYMIEIKKRLSLIEK